MDDKTIPKIKVTIPIIITASLSESKSEIFKQNLVILYYLFRYFV